MTNPFNDISELQKNKLFKLLETHIYTFNKNEEMISTLKSENIICILLEGYAQIVNISYNGEENLIEELTENSVFGTNISNISDNEYQIRAIKQSKILVIDYNKLINKKYINYSYYNVFITNLFDIVNSKCKENNDRIRILTKKTIRDKLLAFFENEYKKSRSKYIYVPTNLKDLADYLSINRSAMFRELKYLKEEKFIKIDGKRITLLYTPIV
ncbi:MAG: hypothetical protein OSJ66_08035 [Clostridia bacterium]|nr:hypothetical protein [Clostridia bacterium]